MIMVEERCAFLDVHRDMVMACARFPDDTGARVEQVQQFTTTSKGLLRLSEWLVERGIGLVGMEATGVYWKPVHWILEGEIERVWVINARHMRNVPGRKTDVGDSQWGCQLLEHGLVRPSFIPERSTREERDLTATGGWLSRTAVGSRNAYTRCWRTPGSSWRRSRRKC